MEFFFHYCVKFSPFIKSIWLLFGISKLPALQRLQFGTFKIKITNHKHCDTIMVPKQGKF